MPDCLTATQLLMLPHAAFPRSFSCALLYLADAHLLADMPQQQRPFTELLSEVMQLVLADLKEAGAKPDEQLLMGLARVAGIMGDPDKVVCARGLRARADKWLGWCCGLALLMLLVAWLGGWVGVVADGTGACCWHHG